MSYLVLDDGRIYGEKRQAFLKPCKNRDGYLYVLISLNGVVRNETVHRIVARTFIPNPFNKRTVNHINGVKDDPRACNLEWNTHSENNLHRFRVLGVRPSKEGNRKLSDRSVLEIKALLKIGKISRKVIARRYCVSASTIDKIAWGKRHKC